MRGGVTKIHFTFDTNTMTRFGGLMPFRQFCNSLDLRHFMLLYLIITS
jgi:hypothetical protein